MISFVSIKDQGSLDNERAVFKVIESGDIGSHVVFCARSIVKNESRQLQNLVYYTYWFLDKQVDKGDVVVLYTKASTQSYKLKINENNSTKTHFFYWKKKETVWNRGDVALVTGNLADWSVNHIDPSDLDIEP